MGLLIEAVEQIPSAAWDQPSNLEGWSIRDLVGHVTGSAAKVVTLVEGGEVWQKPSQPDDWKCEDPAARLRELAARLQDALPNADFDAMRPSPQGEVPLHRALTFPVSDLALHSWDVYRSQGRRSSCPRTCWRSVGTWWSRYRKTCCAGRADSGRPNPYPRTRRRLPG